MEQPLKVCLAHPEWQFAQILTLHDEHIERAELDFLTVPTGMESIEIGDATDAEHYSLAVDDESCVP